MGNGHRVAYDLHQADLTVEDPGNGNRVSIDRNPAVCCFISAGVETRYLVDPSRAGQQVMLCNPSNSVYLAYNNDVDTLTMTAGQTTLMQSIISGTSFEWLTIISVAGDGGGGGGGATNRAAGEDNLGTATTATEIDFNAGNYDNKLLTLGAATIEITLASTASGRFGLTIAQDATGGRLTDFQNATWLGAAEQPQAGAGAKSHYDVFVSGSTYFVRRMT